MTDASDAEIADYYATYHEEGDEIEVKIQPQNRFEALACMEVVALTLVELKQKFLIDVEGALSSGANYHSAAFKLL